MDSWQGYGRKCPFCSADVVDDRLCSLVMIVYVLGRELEADIGGLGHGLHGLAQLLQGGPGRHATGAEGGTPVQVHHQAGTPLAARAWAVRPSERG